VTTLVQPRGAEPSGVGAGVDLGVGAALGDTPLLRINTLPGRRLGSDPLRAALRALVDAEQEVAVLREPACAELFALAATASGARRTAILALKRTIYNGRDPRDRLTAGDWPPATTRWLEAQRRHLVARLALRSGYTGFLAEERAALAEVIGYEPFQLALALGSPQVLEAVRRYRAGVTDPTARDRKSERGILQHAMRAMVRTSPLSRFTAVALGHWSAAGAELDRVGFDRRRGHPVLMVDRPLFCGLVTGLVTPGDPVPGWVERNRSIRVLDGQVRFMRYDGGVMRLLTVPLTRPLHTLLTLTAMGPLPVPRLAALLAERLAGSAEQGHQLVDAAYRAHLLRAAPAVDEQLDDPLPAAKALLRDPHPAAWQLIATVEEQLAELAGATLPGRRAALEQIRVAETRLNALTERPARLHVHEDLVLEPVAVTDRGYRLALDDLAAVTEYLSMFDWHHEVRALLATAVADRYGPGAELNLVDHAESLVAMVYRREATLDSGGADEFAPADGSLQELMVLRHRALTAVTDLLSASDEPEVQVDPGWLAGLAAGMPDRFRRTAASYAVLAQPVDGRLVLGECYPGRGLLGMRFLGVDQRLGGSAARRTARRIERLFGDDGVAVLEDCGLYNSNINQRIPLLANQISAEQWTGIRLVHDAATGTVRLVDPDGTEVRPLSLGMKWPELLPEPVRIAMWLADTDRIIVDPLTWLRASRPAPGVATDRYPRLVAGRVVVQRRRWYPGTDLADVLAGAGGTEPDRAAEQLVRLTRWRATHQVPEEIVLKTPLMNTLDHADPDGPRSFAAGRRREKPQYVDLASALMTRVLPRLMERRGRSYLEEALPGVRRGVRALEWVVEFDRPAGGRFAATLPEE
jgi:hypothetical protein